MKWLREPLVHFLALGVGLFVLFSLVGGGGERDERIVIDARQVQILAEQFAGTWQRPPTAAELQGLIDGHVREEIYYREALAMGLDRDDIIVRRRMRQKLDFFADDLVAAAAPGEGELEAYLAEHPAKFRVEARVSFEQIYLSVDERGEQATADAERLLTRLRGAGDALDTSGLGDRLSLPRRYADAPVDRLDYRFGSGFADQLVELPVGEWAGPIESGYGLHLVRVRKIEPGRLPALVEVRDVVEREWRADRRDAEKEAFYQELLERYEVIVEELPAGSGQGEETDG